MKTLNSNLRLIFSGDTVLLVFSIALLLASLANRTQWPVLRSFRFCGVLTFFLSLAFCLLSGLEAFKPRRRKRTILAAMFFLASTAACLSHMQIETNPAG
jgi:hypothetical protein